MFRHKVCVTLLLIAYGWNGVAHPCQDEVPERANVPKDYAEMRDLIIENELKARGVSGEKLTEAERRVDSYLARLRSQDLSIVRELQRSRRIIAHNRIIRTRPLYQCFLQMPKGAVLHAHAGAIQDLHWLVDTAVGHPECYIYRPNPGEQSELDGCFRLATKTPSDMRWQLVANLRTQSGDPVRFDQRLYESLTLGIEDQGVESIWDEFERCWRRVCSLSDHPSIYRDFYRRELETVAKANVQHLELRTFLDFPYEENQPVPPAKALLQLQALHQDMKRTYPTFRFRVIYSRSRSDSQPKIERYLTEAVELRKQFPHLVSGFDLVGHEEDGRSLLNLVPLFLQAKRRAELDGTTLPLFLHAGETANRGFGNIVDAVLLNTARIGHGLSLMDHPVLRTRIKEQSIPIEICPFSSFVLGNISDVSQHPGRTWYRDGIKICINPDDPGLMGCDLTLDWYLVFVTWQLSLAELKELAKNGIHASSLPEEERSEVLLEWEQRWNEWIEAVDRDAQSLVP